MKREHAAALVGLGLGLLFWFLTGSAIGIIAPLVLALVFGLIAGR